MRKQERGSEIEKRARMRASERERERERERGRERKRRREGEREGEQTEDGDVPTFWKIHLLLVLQMHRKDSHRRSRQVHWKAQNPPNSLCSSNVSGGRMSVDFIVPTFCSKILVNFVAC